MDRGIRIGLAVGLTVGLATIFAIYGRSHSRLITLLNTTLAPQGPRCRVWRVDSEGRVQRFPYDEDILGQTVPLVSPDGRWIAFVNPVTDFDIHLLDAQTLREHRVTSFGHPSKRGYTSVENIPECWSPHGQSLLFQVAPGGTESEEGDLKIPKAPYGFYVYDVSTGTTRPVRLPKEFQLVAWLPDGRFVGVVPGSPSADDKLVILHPGESGETTVTAIDASSYQTRVSADRQWLVGLHSDRGGPPGKGTAQIVRVNLRTMAVISLMNLDWWSGNEQPALSPDDKHVAYKRDKRQHETYYTPQESLFVDGRRIYSCPGPIDFKWVDDRMMALACRNEVLVLDTSSGRTLSTYALGPARPRN